MDFQFIHFVTKLIQVTTAVWGMSDHHDAVTEAYDRAMPPSDRLLNLVEAPLGAKALLSGLMRQQEGNSLFVMVL